MHQKQVSIWLTMKAEWEEGQKYVWCDSVGWNKEKGSFVKVQLAKSRKLSELPSGIQWETGEKWEVVSSEA